MSNSIFRKKPLEHMESPEKLDAYMKVTNPGVWSVLIACLALAVAAAVWLGVGSIPSTLDMKGVLFPGSGSVSVLAPGSGQIVDMRVSTGDMVQPHDLLAVISRPDLLEELQAFIAANPDNKEAIAQKQREYEQATVVRSEVYGVVLEAKHLGDILQTDEPMVSLARLEEGTNIYHLICYVPEDTARRLETGMEVQVNPSYASREQYGYMYGYISGVGEYAVTDEDIQAQVGRKQYVAAILPQENAIQVEISLVLDPNAEDAANGAKWSHSIGNSLEFTIGMECDVLVVLKEQKPYELLLDL